MWSKLHLRRGYWTVVDQGIVSGGTFLVNVFLARQLPAAEYGVFAVLFSGMFLLQLIPMALLLYPLGVRLLAVEESERVQLLRSTLIFAAGLAAASGGVLAATLSVFGRAELVLPAVSCFFFWQMQEAMRRGLLATFRHKAAVLGDALSYIGQGLVVLVLVFAGTLTLSRALCIMAATSALAAVVQYIQLRLRFLGPVALRRTAAEYWYIGGFWSLGNSLLAQLRNHLLPWVLALDSGPTAAAALQAAANVVNMSNPIMFSVHNIIPQTAAQAHGNGNASAWQAARVYALLSMPLILAYAAVVLAMPTTILVVFYGAESEYLEISLVVRLLTVTALVGYAADVVVSFLLGVVKMHAALLINLAGALVVAGLVVPLVQGLGLTGVCLVALAANLARLAVSCAVMARVLAETPDAGCRKQFIRLNTRQQAGLQP